MKDGVSTFVPRKFIKPTNKSKRSCPYSPGLLHKVHLKRIAFKNRPVSLTSIICKLFESFLRDALYDHLVKNNLLSKHQFGFCKGRSCISQLLVVIQEWMSCIDKDVPTDAIYLDFSKAFDTVPHKKLIHKLKGYGISGNILSWITDFLSGRLQMSQ